MAHWSDEDDDEMSGCDSSEEDEDGADRRMDVIGKLQSGRAKLQFVQADGAEGRRVYCPVCTSRDPKADLQALWKHSTSGSSGKDKKLYRAHRELAKFIVEHVLQMPSGHPADRDVAAAKERYYRRKEGVDQPETAAGQIPEKRTADSSLEDLCAPDLQRAGTKVAKVYAHTVSGGGKLEIMWPPSVLLSFVTARRHVKPDKPSTTKVEKWMGEHGKFCLLKQTTIKERHTYHGPTGEFLVTFPATLDGFLEAVQLELLMDQQQDKLDVTLQGRIVVGRIPNPWNSMPKYRLESFSKRVLSLAHGQLKMLAEAQEDAVTAVVDNQRLTSALRETNWKYEQMSSNVSEIEQKFQQASQQAERSRMEAQATRAEYKKLLEDKETEQDQRVTQIRQEYEEHVKSLQQETEQVAQQLEELQLNHNLHQMRFEEQHREELKKLEDKHHNEKLKLWKKHEEERKKSEREYNEKLKTEKMTAAEMKQWMQRRAVEEARKRKDDQRVERMLAQVKHHFDDELRKKTADYQEELDDFENTCKCLMLKERRANDQVVEVEKIFEQEYKKHIDAHWMFASSLLEKPQANAVVMKEIGALASNKKFRKELWGSACRKYGLPEGTKRDGSKLKSRKLGTAHNDAIVFYTTELTRMQTEYVENPNYEPFKTKETGIVPNNEGLEDLRDAHGSSAEGVFLAMRAVVLELHEYNPSGRYPVYKMWLPEADRKASLSEAMRHLNERGEYLFQRYQDAKAGAERSSRSRPAALHMQ